MRARTVIVAAMVATMGLAPGVASANGGAYIEFEGEGHGFRKAETIKAAIEAQIYFLGRMFGFEPADQVPPISIDNLSR